MPIISGIPSISPVAFQAAPATVATLYSMYPPAQYVRNYVWVTDLHDGQPDVVISDGTYWKPTRPLAARAVANSDSAMTLTTLTNAPTQIMKGVLTANRAITLSTVNAYPGAKFRIKREATGTLLTLLVNGIGLGLNSWVDMEYDTAQGWVQTASGGLL